MNNEIKVSYKGYTATSYTDYMRFDKIYEVYGYTIWKGDEYLLYATLGKPLTEAELMDILKHYVDDSLQEILLEEI